MSIEKLKQILEISNTKQVDVGDVLKLLAEIIIAQDARIEELELTIDSLERRISNV